MRVFSPWSEVRLGINEIAREKGETRAHLSLARRNGVNAVASGLLAYGAEQGFTRGIVADAYAGGGISNVVDLTSGTKFTFINETQIFNSMLKDPVTVGLAYATVGFAALGALFALSTFARVGLAARSASRNK